MRTLVVLLVLTTCCRQNIVVSVSAQLRHHTREPVKDDDVSLENALELYRAAKDVVNPTTHELWRNESLGLGSPPPPAYYRNISAADDREDLGVFLDELRTFKGLGLHSDNVQKKKYSPPMPPYAQPPRPPEPPAPISYETHWKPPLPPRPGDHTDVGDPPDFVDPPVWDGPDVRKEVQGQWDDAVAAPPPAPWPPNVRSFDGFEVPHPREAMIKPRHAYHPGSYCERHCTALEDSEHADVLVRTSGRDAEDLGGGVNLFVNHSAVCMSPTDMRLRGDDNRELVLLASWRGHDEDIVIDFFEQMSGFLAVRNDMHDDIWESKGYRFNCASAKAIAISGQALFVAVAGRRVRPRAFAHDPSIHFLIEGDLSTPPPPAPSPPLPPGAQAKVGLLQYTSLDDAVNKHNLRLRGVLPRLDAEQQPRRRGRRKQKKKKKGAAAAAPTASDAIERLIRVQKPTKVYSRKKLGGTVEYLSDTADEPVDSKGNETQPSAALAERQLCNYVDKVPMDYPTEFPLVNRVIYVMRNPVISIVRQWVIEQMPIHMKRYKQPTEKSFRYVNSNQQLLPISFGIYVHKLKKITPNHRYRLNHMLIIPLRKYLLDHLESWAHHLLSWRLPMQVPHTWTVFERFSADPRGEYNRLAAFLDLPGMHGDTGVSKEQQKCALEAVRVRMHEEQGRTWRMLQNPYNDTSHEFYKIDNFNHIMDSQKNAFDQVMHLMHIEFCAWTVARKIRKFFPPEYEQLCADMEREEIEEEEEEQQQQDQASPVADMESWRENLTHAKWVTTDGKIIDPTRWGYNESNVVGRGEAP